jgi:hypothetical protein
MVVAQHSSVAYTDFAHVDSTNYLASTAPVVDEARWLFFDYAESTKQRGRVSCGFCSSATWSAQRE